MPRPNKYNAATIFRVNARSGHRLHADSDRRRIIQTMIEAGGRMTLAELDDAFKQSMRIKAAALVRAGWLSAEEGDDAAGEEA